MSLSQQIAASNKAAVHKIVAAFINGNRKDARSALESFSESPVTVALLAIRSMNRLPADERKSFVNWLTALAE